MMKLAPKKIYDFNKKNDEISLEKSMILNLPIQLRKIFSLRGSVIVNTLKPKWA